MVALEVSLPSLRRSLVRSLLPVARRAPSFPPPLRSPARCAPPARRSLAATRCRGSVAAPRSPEPVAPADRTVPPAAGTDPPSTRAGRGAGGRGAAGRSPGRNQGWAGGGDAGVPELRSRSELRSVAGARGRTIGSRREPSHPTKCDAPKGLRRAAIGARKDRFGAARRAGAAPERGGGPGLRPERAPCPVRADGPEPALSGRAGQVSGRSRDPRIPHGGWAGDSSNSPARSHSRLFPGSLCVCKLPARGASGAERSPARGWSTLFQLGRPRRTDPGELRDPAPGPGP